MKKLLLLGASSLLAIAGTAHAQSAPQRAGDLATADTPSEQEATPAGEAATPDILVTGSRTITNGNSAPTPVTVVSTQRLAVTTPSNIPDGLNKLPQFTNSSGVATASNGGTNSAGNVLNLRGFGGIRTLILLDGHRVPPTSADGTVDTNILPQMLMSRVDVVTGGVSAVYGSDAITGVVNFILDKKFNGLRATIQNGISSRGDKRSWRAGIVGGTDLLDGRGHIEATYEHYDSAGLPDKTQRRIGARAYSETGVGTTANPFRLSSDTRLTLGSFGGLIFSGPLAGYDFATDGVATPFVRGAPTGSAGIDSGGNGAYFNPSTALASLKTDQAFTRFDYDIGGDTQFYAQGSWSRSQNVNNFAPSLILFKEIAADNAFLSPAVQAAAAAGGATSFLLNRFFGNTSGVSVDSTVTNWSGTAGLQGKIGDFAWDVGYTHARARTHGVTSNNLNNGRLAAALDAVSSNGAVVCRVSVTNPGLYPGCTPLNPFGPTAYGQAALDYVRGETDYRLTNTLDNAFGSVSGDLFNLPAGPVRVAVSGEYRRQKLTNVSSAQPTETISCTGLRYNCVPGGTAPWFLNIVANVDARQSIAEGAVELNVPLLRDVPLIEELAINGAYRYSRYSVSGSANTWKVGIDWHVFDDLRLRGTRSRDFRAPTLFDLFAPINASVVGYFDIHTNTTGAVTQQTRGNPNLSPEVAN